MPIRDALVRLEVEGLVDVVPQRGARVSAVSVVDLEDTYRTRVALEAAAVRWAAGRMQREDLDRLRAVLDRYAHSDEMTGREYHRQFHFGLYALSGSRWILRLVAPLWENSERYRRLSLWSRGSIDDRRREHERILDACYSGDAQASAELLTEHLARTADLVKQALAAREADETASTNG